MASTNKPNTLNSVATAFNQWRASGKNRKRVPDELRRQAVGLLKSYRKNEILRAIGTNHNMLNRWANELAIESPEPPKTAVYPLLLLVMCPRHFEAHFHND